MITSIIFSTIPHIESYSYSYSYSYSFRLPYHHQRALPYSAHLQACFTVNTRPSTGCTFRYVMLIRLAVTSAATQSSLISNIPPSHVKPTREPINERFLWI